MKLVPASGPILDRILDVSFELWGDGLTQQDYARYNAAQLRTEWGAARLQRLALVDAGAVLATAKRYDLEARIDGTRPACSASARCSHRPRRGAAAWRGASSR